VDSVSFREVPRIEARRTLPLLEGVRCMSAVLRQARRLQADIYHIHEPMLIPAGCILRLAGKTVIYDVHEDWPRQAINNARNKGAWTAGLAICAGWSVLEWVARIAFQRFVCATPHIARRFPERRTCVCRNLPDRDLATTLHAAADRIPYPSRPNHAISVGNLTLTRGIREALEALERIPEQLGARLVVAGDCVPPSLLAQVKTSPGWHRVEYLGWVDRTRVIDELSRARMGLLLFHPTENHVHALPNKLFEYMAAGLPVVVSNFPAWRKIVQGHGCGLVVDPLSPSSIAEAVEYLLNHPAEAEQMGGRGRHAIRNEFNWETEQGKLVALYDELSGRPQA